MRRLALTLLASVLLSGSPAASHPGRLNAEGCHTVRKDFTYTSGKVMRKGEYHCHRGLVGKPIILDGHEVLAERGDEHRDDESETREGEQSP